MKQEAPQPNKENCSQSELEIAMNAAASGRSRDRMRAILSQMRNVPEAELVKVFLICERTLRNWVTRFNESGIDGLITCAIKTSL